MAVIETEFAPGLLQRVSAPFRKMQRTSLWRKGPLDRALEDFLTSVTQPGDKVLQLGSDDGVAAAFLDRGAFLHLVAPAQSADAVESICQLRGCSPARMRLFETMGGSAMAGTVDAVWLSKTPSLPVLAAHFRHAETRLKPGGKLFLGAITSEHTRQFYKQLRNSADWQPDELIAGEVAVFRRH
ncbi:MAG: hypothetical protein DHS20C06_18500 [Hyphobacterium sp.]|nr:MAG: hypothetical protein DHS20C06_18500 [Hyphobacterium sp.]